jgi:hypothetical protein
VSWLLSLNDQLVENNGHFEFKSQVLIEFLILNVRYFPIEVNCSRGLSNHMPIRLQRARSLARLSSLIDGT